VRPNERWSLDLVSDQLTDGRRFRMLAAVDDCARESLCLIDDTPLSGQRVAPELDALIVERVRSCGPCSCTSEPGVIGHSVLIPLGAKRLISIGVPPV